MKIAFFSDVHANLPALEAVLADIDSQQPDAVYCLGDLVGYNIWPNEVIDTIRKRQIPTIRGNYDEGIGKSSDDCGCAYKTEDEQANGAVSIALTNQLVTPTSRQWLRRLPAHLRIEFDAGPHPYSLLMVHGSPRKVNEYLFEDRAEKSLLRIMQDAQAGIMLFGHTHKPYHRVLKTSSPEGDDNFHHAINIGSVGKPKDGDPRACYALLTLTDDPSLKRSDFFTLEFKRVPYDVERAARAVEESILPNAYAEALRLAK